MNVFWYAQRLNFFDEIHDVILVFLQVVGEQQLQINLLFQLKFNLA